MPRFPTLFFSLLWANTSSEADAVAGQDRVSITGHDIELSFAELLHVGQDLLAGERWACALSLVGSN